LLPFLLAAACALAALAVAPAARAGTLRDDAGFFSPDARPKVQAALDRIQQSYGRNVAVETYPAPPASVPTGGDERARNEAYHAWAQQRGKELGADVLVLITRNPSHLRVDSREALKQSGQFTAADQDAASAVILPLFKQRRYDDGIMQGVEFIERKLAQPGNRTQSSASGSGGASYPPPPGSSGSGRTNVPQQRTPMVGCGGGGVGSFVCLAIVVIGVFMIIRGITRRSGYGGGGPGPGYGQPGYGQPGYGGGYGGGGGGGFGSGFGGGMLGGLLSGWLFNRTTHGGGFGSGYTPSDPSAGGGLPPTDPSSFGGGGGDFGGGGGDFGGGGDVGGGGGGGDAGGGGGDF
jgi:uncharacterized protein